MIFASMGKLEMILKLNNRAQVLDTYRTQEAFTNLNSSHISYLYQLPAAIFHLFQHKHIHMFQ